MAAEGNSRGSAPLDSSGVKSRAGVRSQTAVIYDLLSEGPIEGLVDGVASIRLNDNPVANTVNTNKISPQQTFDANYVASTGVITDNSTGNIFSGASTADGNRQVLIAGGSKRTTSSINCIAGNNIVTSTNLSNMTFASSDVWNGTGIQPMIRIDGAGDNGGQLIAGITEQINTSAIRVDTVPMTTVSNTAAYIDLVDDIDSFSGNTATISSGGVNVANTIVIMGSPTRTQNDAPLYNYENFGFAFRTGTRNQEWLPTPVGIGSASVAHQVSSGAITTSSSSGYPSAAAFGFAETTAYSGSPLIVTSSTMGVGNASEVDALKITLGFNTMISQKENGKLGPGFAEYRIKFGYSRDGGSTYQDVTKIGRATISTSTSRYHANGRTKDAQSGIISMKTKQPFNHVYTFDISKYQPFDAYRVSIERISAVNQKENSWQQTNSGVVKQIENIITDKLTYPYSAYAGVVVDAKDFQSVPKRSYEIRGLKVKVPTNYFPIDEANTATGIRRSTAAYTRNVTDGTEEVTVQDWDGNFRGDQKTFTNPTSPNYEPVYTNNPIWIFYDLLTNQRYGLGKYLDEDFDFSQIDKYTLFQLAKYCDELVPNGKGGTEPRFTCNLYITKDQDAIKVLKNLASQLRAMLIWYNGEITLGMNQQKGAIYTFSKSNVIDGAFNYAGTAGRFRHNQVAVTWNDPENGYKQAVEVVEDHDNIARTGKIRRKNVTAYGCTSLGQAIRHGKYQLLTEQLEKEVVTFTTGLNALGLKPGDVIKVQDSDLQDIVCSGRVTTSSASTTTVIKTDRNLTSFLNNDDNFKLHLIYPNGGAYLAQPTAIINSTTYSQGDLILLDEDGNSIDTHAKASNLKDDSGAVVQTFWSDDFRVETQSISSFNASSITVSAAFTSAPNGEVMYTVSGETDDNIKLAGTFKEYIITSIKHNDKMLLDITAADYFKDKFDAIDRGWKVPEYPDTLYKPPARADEVPVPVGLTAQIVPGSANGGDTVGDGETDNDYSIVLNWSHPTTQRTDSEGNSLVDVYEHLAGYNIQHNLTLANNDTDSNRQFTTIELNSNNKTDFTFNGVVPGAAYIMRVQTVSNSGKTSGWVQRTLSFPDSAFAIFGAGAISAGLNKSIQKGGILTTVANVDSSNGTVTFANNTYVFTPPNSVPAITIASGNTAQTVQDGFNNLADGDTGYLLYDYGDTSDPLKAIELVTDSTAEDADTSAKYNYQFMARLGESNNDLVQATGTVSATAGLPELTGSSTTFTSDFTEGDVIAIDTAGATRFMATVIEVANNTSLVMDSSPTRNYSAKTVHKQGLTYDHLKDSIIGEITRNGSTYSYTPFTNKMKVDTSDEIGDNTITVAQLSANSVNGAIIQANSIGAAAIIAGTIGNAEMAANSIGSAQIIAGQIDSSHISANSIGSAAITANAITSSEISANAIGTVAIQSNSITAAQLTSDAVGAFTVSANSITSVELASNSVDTVQIAANSVTSLAIQANAIGSSEIALNSVNGTIIAGNAVGSTQIALNSVNGIIIAGGAVDTDQLAGSAVEAAKIAANAVNNEKVAANAIDTNEIRANAVTAVIVAANAITTNQLEANSVNASIVAANAIESNQLKANSVTAAAILAGTITNNEIQANTINSVVIDTEAVGTNQISANAITNAKISTGAVNNASIASGSNIDFAKINAANAITNAMISASGAIDFAKIAVSNGSINTAVLAANVITNAKISSTDNMTITLTDGSAGGWNVNATDFSSTNASGGGNAAFTNAGIKLGAAGYISANQFYIDTAGNAKFKGDITGATGTFSGSISIGNVTGAPDTAAMNTATSNAATTANSAFGQANSAFGQANTATTNAATADTKAGNAYNQANTATTNAATAQSTADSKVTHAAVNTSSTIVGGGVGGWGITTYHLAGGAQASAATRNFTIGTSSSGNATFLANGGIVMGSDGFISANQFYVDTAGNAKFKGTLEGDDVTVNGTLVLPSEGANVSGGTIGTFANNVMDNKHITSVGSGPGFYQGFVRLTGGTDHVKTISIQARTGTSTASEGTLIYETPRVDLYTAGNLSEGRLFSSAQTANMPIAFTFTGAGNVSMFIRAQGDGNETLGSAEARFIKFGTTDPVYSFANQFGVALNTAFYSNTQVVGGFAGTKTVSISNTSFTRFKIDNGSFGTANSQIANGSYINVEITSAATNLTFRSTTVTIGETTADFTVGTGGTIDPPPPPPPNGEGGCFVQGTPIVMADGTTKAIEDVNVGESVKSFRHSSLSLDENAWETWTTTEIGNGSFGNSNVVALTNPHTYTNYYWINYNLKVTNEHPMLAFKDGVFKFVRVQDLIVGDFLVRENGTREEIFAIPRITESCITYNMDVEDDDTYVVRGGNGTGYIAHNVEEQKEV